MKDRAHFSRRTLSQALLGAFDGSNTGLGLILGLLAGASVSGLLKVALPATAAGMASMALGVLGADDENGWPEAVVMGVVWLAACLVIITTGALVPVPLLWVVVAGELAAMGVGITAARDGHLGLRGVCRTYGILASTGLVAAATAVLL